ncbi:MAG: HAD family hydrolase [Acidimicrobiales bacterium]|jgi:hydroxymethylpyrimidine pyrophosphatase-like HAD family hydrolase
MADQTESPRVDLVVTDLDGTLWDQSGVVHPRTLGALRLLADASVPVLAASGRRPFSAWPVMEANGIALPAVFLDGAIGRDFRATTSFHRHAFTSSAAEEALGVFESLGVSPCVNVDDPVRDIVLGKNPSIHPEYLRRLGPWVREEDPWTAARTLGVLAFTLLGGERSWVLDLSAQVTARVPVTAAVSTDRTYGGLHVSFRPIGVTKWAGVLAFCAAHRLDPRHVFAIGDGDNDAELLDAASVAAAVADASPAALQLADHVLPPASEGGWAEILPLLGLSGE